MSCISSICKEHAAEPAAPAGGYWALPLSWLQNAIEINEFSDPRWQSRYVYDPSVRACCSLFPEAALHQGSMPAPPAVRACVHACHVCASELVCALASGSMQTG